MVNGQASMSSTAAVIKAATTGRKSIVLSNIGSKIVYVGKDASVTSSNGFPLAAADTLLDEKYTGDWYGVCNGSDTSTICFIEEE